MKDGALDILKYNSLEYSKKIRRKKMEYKKLYIKDIKDEGIVEIDSERLIDIEKRGNMYHSKNISTQSSSSIYIDTSRMVEFTNHAFYLDDDYDWVLGKDSIGSTILVPLRKNMKSGEM